MADDRQARRISSGERIRRLTEAYRAILTRYERIQELARRERSHLLDGRPLDEVNAILREKKSVLAEIRHEEDQVTVAREWWKKARRTVPPAACRDLLALLDEISKRIEAILALESECRALLERTVAWGGASLGPGAPNAAGAAAYARGAAPAEGT